MDNDYPFQHQSLEYLEKKKNKNKNTNNKQPTTTTKKKQTHKINHHTYFWAIRSQILIYQNPTHQFKELTTAWSTSAGKQKPAFAFFLPCLNNILCHAVQSKGGKKQSSFTFFTLMNDLNARIIYSALAGDWKMCCSSHRNNLHLKKFPLSDHSFRPWEKRLVCSSQQLLLLNHFQILKCKAIVSQTMLTAFWTQEDTAHKL